MPKASKTSRRKPLVLVSLNEINCEIVQAYLDAHPGLWPNWRRLLASARSHTEAEQRYEELEPWIQWPSVYTGRPYAEHGFFRLGDAAGGDVPQMFEQLEESGLKVGCLAPMNTVNRLRKPAYFLPDPWTNTSTDGGWWTTRLYRAIRQTVNDNAQVKVSRESAVALVAAVVRCFQWRHSFLYLRLAAMSRHAQWPRALLLDLLLHDWHRFVLEKKKPDFSTVFLNAGAHIQHHYFLNAAPLKAGSYAANPAWYLKPEIDPLHAILSLYDDLLGDYLDDPDREWLIATGLRQVPYERPVFYYRLRNHAGFLRRLGLGFRAVHPRMTRDFHVDCDSKEQAETLRQALASLQLNGEPLFSPVEGRGSRVFATLSYSRQMPPEAKIHWQGKDLDLKPAIVFVAIKNGIHHGQGDAFFSPGMQSHQLTDGDKVWKLYDSVMGYFGLRPAGRKA